MPYIATIDESDASDDLAALYGRVANRDGTVDNVMKIHNYVNRIVQGLGVELEDDSFAIGQGPSAAASR